MSAPNKTLTQRAEDMEAGRHKAMTSGDENVNNLLLIVLAVLLPPLAVWLKLGADWLQIVLNVVLCCIFWLPGIVHALWAIFFRDTK